MSKFLTIFVSSAILSCGNSGSSGSSPDPKVIEKEPSQEGKKVQGTSGKEVAKNKQKLQYSLLSKTPFQISADKPISERSEDIERCLAAFEDLKSKQLVKANPYSKPQVGEKSWRQLFERLVPAPGRAEVSFSQFVFSASEGSAKKKISISCNAPDTAKIEDPRFEVAFPSGMQNVDESKKFIPDNGRSYGLRKIGGIHWDSNYSDFYAYMDRIIFNWGLRTVSNDSEEEFAKDLFQGLEVLRFESIIDAQNPCLGRAIQVSSDSEFKNASLFAAPDEKFCEPNFRFLSSFVGFNPSESGEAEYTLDVAMPVSQLDTMVPDCRGTLGGLNCRRVLVPSIKAVFEETLAKEKTLFVRILVKTKQSGKFILGKIEVDKDGLVKVTESRFVTDCTSEGLPIPLCIDEFRTEP